MRFEEGLDSWFGGLEVFPFTLKDGFDEAFWWRVRCFSLRRLKASSMARPRRRGCNRRILVYTFCVINICLSLSDDANKIKTLNIERA